MPVKTNNRFSDYFRLAIVGDWCVYCGMLATQREHFPPATCERWGYILPSCGECNRFAGTQAPYDFDARTGIVKGKLRSRNQRLLNTPDWGADEIAELSGETKREVTRWQKRKKRVQERLAWPALEYLLSIDRSSVFVPNPVASYFTIESESENFSNSEDSRRKQRYAQRVSKAVARWRPEGGQT